MVFDGRQWAQEIYKNLGPRVVALKAQGVTPRLVWICVGTDPASVMYGRLKRKAAENIGIEFEEKRLTAGVSLETLRNLVLEANTDEKCTGVMVQLPIETEGNIYQDVLAHIDAKKDVDCLNPYSIGLVMADQWLFLPATVLSVVQIILYGMGHQFTVGTDEYICQIKKPLVEKRAVVIGGGWEVGKPLVAILSNLGASVIWLRSGEKNLDEMVRLGDIVVSATGVANLVVGRMVHKDSIVVDVGAPEGDVDFASVSSIAGLITPVPGGVGPVTVASLMMNVMKAGEMR